MCISIFCKCLSGLHLFPPSCISQTWISILKRVIKSLLFLCGSISNKIAYRGLHSHGKCTVIIGCPAVTWLMQTLHLSLQNHLSAGLEYSKQLNKKDQKKEDDTESSIYTSLIRHDEFSNLNICFLRANQGKKNADHNLKRKTLHKINLLQTDIALKDRERKRDGENLFSYLSASFHLWHACYPKISILWEKSAGCLIPKPLSN